jgi:hypothetical protein
LSIGNRLALQVSASEEGLKAMSRSAVKFEERAEHGIELSRDEVAEISSALRELLTNSSP